LYPNWFSSLKKEIACCSRILVPVCQMTRLHSGYECVICMGDTGDISRTLIFVLWKLLRWLTWEHHVHIMYWIALLT
jgi:hypothetical protein